MHNRFSDKAIRSKHLSKMSPEEKALLFLEAERSAEALKGRYKGESNTLLAISNLLKQEAERLQQIEEQQKPKPTTPSPVRFGENNFSLFDEGDNH